MNPLHETSSASIESARVFLSDTGMDDERSNERSARVLLALAHLTVGDPWADATNNLYTLREIMDWIDEKLGYHYKPNSRETIRRFTLHQFMQTGFVEYNFDQPDRPTNSPKSNYRISPLALALIRAIGTDVYAEKRSLFFERSATWKELQSEPRKMAMVPISLPEGGEIHLSPGGQNDLIKSIIEVFCPRFAKGGTVLFIGDTSKENEVIDQELMDQIGVVLPVRGKEPDVIVWREDKNWLYLLEACSSHGPVDVTRKNELKQLFGSTGHELVLVSCFPSRSVMRKYLDQLAWETEVWCADTPDHLIHFDGEKFLGPY